MKTISTAITVTMLAVCSLSSYAADVHLKGGRNAEPEFTDKALTLEIRTALSGLGNEDLLVQLVAEAIPEAVCINPSDKDGKDQQPPGQNPAPITVTGSDLITAEEIGKNGNVHFTLETDAPETPIPGAPDCPNPNWTEEIVDLAFTQATLFVYQPPGNLVLTVTCEFASPTEDGIVDPDAVECATDP